MSTMIIHKRSHIVTRENKTAGSPPQLMVYKNILLIRFILFLFYKQDAYGGNSGYDKYHI